jgi:hypothetical protein
MTPLEEKPSQISQSRDCLDWDALRLQSLAPGGFGPARAHIWYLFFARNDKSPSYFLNQANAAPRSHEYPGNTRGNLSPIETSARYASIRIAASCSTP